MKLIKRLGTFLLFAHALGFAQSDVTGFWKFRVPNGGVSYLELKQTGETVTATARGGRPVTLGVEKVAPPGGETQRYPHAGHLPF